MQKQKGIFPPQRDPARGGTTLITGIIIIIVVAVILFGGVFAYQYFTTKSQQNSKFFGSSQKTNQIQTQIAGWKTYTNSQYGFEINYPDNFLSENPVVKNVNCADMANNCPYIGVDGAIVKSDSENFSDFVRQGFVKKTKQIIVNNQAFCFQEMFNSGAGSGNIYDYYLTTSKQDCFSLLLNTSYSDPYDSIATQKHDVVISQIISTFKFTK